MIFSYLQGNTDLISKHISDLSIIYIYLGKPEGKAVIGYFSFAQANI